MLTERLANQLLTRATGRRCEDTVGWFGAMQAQDYIGAKWAIALRTPRLSEPEIERAFADGRILRTHVLRPTWHLVRSEDIKWMGALNASRLARLSLTYAARLGLDAPLLTRARGVVERALEGGRTLTRAELSVVLRRARIEASGQRLAHLLFDLEQHAVICSGPLRGKQFTYALLDERVPAAPTRSRDEALAELASRYFRSHGPATLRDFGWWSGLQMADVRKAVALARVDPLPSPPALQRATGATYLLPNYDEFLVAYRDRGAVIDPERARNLGVFTTRELPHHLVIDGRLGGSWRRTITATSLRVDVCGYRKLSPAQKTGIDRQAARYATFLGLPYVLGIT